MGGDTPYWQLFYHIVWATKYRQPLVTPEVEEQVYGYLRGKAIGLGATVFALNGVADQVHMVAAIPPKIAIAAFTGQIKAVAATRFNKSGASFSLFWQEEYGAFSCDRGMLPNYIAYVERQKEHHAQRTTIPILERTEGGVIQVVREPPPIYAADDHEWRLNMLALDDSAGN